MHTTLSRIISTGVLALAVVTAVTAGSAAAGTDTTEPVDATAGSSTPPADMAPGCAEVVALLDIQTDLARAFMNEDGAALGALLGSLPELGAAAQAAAP